MKWNEILVHAQFVEALQKIVRFTSDNRFEKKNANIYIHAKKVYSNSFEARFVWLLDCIQYFLNDLFSFMLAMLSLNFPLSG